MNFQHIFSSSLQLFDLLNERTQIKCLEDSQGKVCFPGLTEHPVRSPDNVMELIEQGAANRSTGTTSRNADSSRSHAVLHIKLMKNAGRKKNIEHSKSKMLASRC
jgi:kinesin family protein 2/24